ncbi:MAG: restriction endonuclease subunit R [Candidatus Omnitrophota bacterium]|jgi:type III restriction enzyme|nr:MAG: restriction endonuclease subunit R [Candidatus Omnitrophota bacterium]
MKQVVIENPIINSPFAEPQRHFKFDEEGITNEIIESRRISSYFIPVPRAKKKGLQQTLFETEWTQERVRENDFINLIRSKVIQWREGGYYGITKTTRRLLEYWKNPEREHRLFFCQIEALETVIYVAEVAPKHDVAIRNEIQEGNSEANPLLYRIAFKMATGSGKTVVMAMMIAWQTLNKIAYTQDRRFSDAFLIISPGITIRDRLRVLLPNDPNNYYCKHDIIPKYNMDELGKAKIVITNFHQFKQREKGEGSKLTKKISGQAETGVNLESPGQMVRRVCRDLGNKKNVIVINDEAHHCYRHRVEDEKVKLKGDERKEAEKRNEEARIWISGIEAVKEKIGVRMVYDLSATPFFLRGSGYKEGTLFPWVVSDFSLIDAIESGIVKVPRVPVADDAVTGDQPTYRDLWIRIKNDLPKKGRKTEAVSEEPKLPKQLEGALKSLYDNYEKYYRLWEAEQKDNEARGITPPVFIVVCNNTNVSKMVYNYISGWEKPLKDGSSVIVPGELAIFSNEENGRWKPRPNTILIDSEQLDSEEAMSKEFKKIASQEIEQFKAEYLQRFPGRDVEKLTDEDLLREVMNTVGKPGRLGEQIKCVVSVSMLTEGWDANTVTHILGVRAFGTQLLCEQVVGRGLRRISYSLENRVFNVNGKSVELESFPTEYAEVYGVPFSFIPCAGSTTTVTGGAKPSRVRALEERSDCEIRYPRLMGYRYDVKRERLTATFDQESTFTLSTEDVPSWTENKPIVGESSLHTIASLRERRLQQVAFRLAKLVLEKYFRADGNGESSDSNDLSISEVQAWLFPDILEIAKQWLGNCLVCKDNTFPQMLLLVENAHQSAEKIYNSIVKAVKEEKVLKPILYPYDTEGSSRYIDFDTAKPVYDTRPDKCHVNYVVADTESWEQKMAVTLEEMDEVEVYIKNHNLGFTIPYTFNGKEHNYIPDFIAKVRLQNGELLNLILEVTGQKRKDKEIKVATAKNLWVPAVNNHGGFGKWDFMEIDDPWNAKHIIRYRIDVK